MAASTIPFVISGELTLPPDDGAAPVASTVSVSGSFLSEEGGRLVLVGSGTKVVSFGSVGAPGAKAVYIEYLQPSTGPDGAPLNVSFNGGSGSVEISCGGFLLLGSPAPVVGVTALSIAYTTDAALRVRLIG